MGKCGKKLRKIHEKWWENSKYNFFLLKNGFERKNVKRVSKIDVNLETLKIFPVQKISYTIQ